jgi:hypothetical protein
MMYHIKKVEPTSSSSDIPKRAPGAIIPISNIRQSCMLFPAFPKDSGRTPSDWTTDNVLDKCSSFFVNNWLSKYSYQSIW